MITSCQVCVEESSISWRFVKSWATSKSVFDCQPITILRESKEGKNCRIESEIIVWTESAADLQPMRAAAVISRSDQESGICVEFISRTGDC